LEIEEKGVAAAAKEKASLGVLESALEMTARGFKFQPVDLYRSDATKFRIDETDRRSLIPPFAAVQGISAGTASQIANAREDGELVSVEDFRKRTKVSKTVIETLERLGCFRGMSESNQLALF
jgi:DNA polymerase-3 subunit alpha (Gram-positive type)